MVDRKKQSVVTGITGKYGAYLAELSTAMRLLQSSEAHGVYNLAAQSFVGVSVEQPITTSEITGLGAVNLREAIRIVDRSMRFYQVSTSECSARDRPCLKPRRHPSILTVQTA